jgi:hypothetical protein
MAAVSVMSNIAEGFARKSRKDFSHSLSFARASAVEVQSLLFVAFDTTGMDRSQFDVVPQVRGSDFDDHPANGLLKQKRIPTAIELRTLHSELLTSDSEL